MSDNDSVHPPTSRVTRRQMLRGLGAGGALLAGAPLLAACGGSSSTNSSATTAVSTGGSSATTAGSSSAGGSTASGSVADITKFVTIDTAHSGKGLTIDCGGVLAFTGAGAFFGRTMSAGMKLAAQHILALGGPTFNLVFKDHKSGDPQAGVTAAKELGFAKTPCMLASYGDDIGAMLPLQAQYKIFTLDGGGGTGLFAEGKPYFWGARAITPDDTYPGVTMWMKQKLANVKTVVSEAWDAGQFNAPGQADLKAKMAAIGVNVSK